MPSVIAILFDMDNTLLDFVRYKRETAKAAAKAMVAHGLPATEQEAYNRIFKVYQEKGIEYQKTFYDVVAPYNLELNKAEKIQHAGIIAYQKRKFEVLKPYPGVKETLATLRRRGFLLGIVSDAPRNKVWDRLIMSGLEDMFDVVVSHSDTQQLKPHPTPFQLALKQLKVSASHVLFVGDDPSRDIKGAKALGMKTALAKYGETWKKHKDLCDSADYHLERIGDLLKLL
ncbi:MAG: HAD-IIIA family hydrolase [Candidatus Micrarchaeota archaeon]|nr:HAD-IIIA family hydrolase [Candidatus Micrarchaeota archaeon]